MDFDLLCVVESGATLLCVVKLESFYHDGDVFFPRDFCVWHCSWRSPELQVFDAILTEVVDDGPRGVLNAFSVIDEVVGVLIEDVKERDDRWEGAGGFQRYCWVAQRCVFLSLPDSVKCVPRYAA